MARYIDAEKVKRNIRVNLMPNVDVDGTVTVENAERYFLNLIDKTSTADVAEVKHGKWVDRYSEKYDNHMYECSECRKKALYDARGDELGSTKITQVLSPVCPWCGAIMDE